MTVRKNTIISFFPLVVFILTTLLGLTELFTHQGLIINNLGISYLAISVLALIGLTCYRFFFHRYEQGLMQTLTITNKLSLLSFVISIVGAITFFTLDVYYFPNYTFSQLGINSFMALELSVLSLGTYLLTASFKQWRKYGLTYLLLVFLTVCLYWYIFYPFFFISLGQGEPFHGTDDTIFEWLQVILLILSAGGAFLAARLSKTSWAKAFCIIALFGSIFLAGEEISWGQRQFGLDTEQLEFLTRNNNQNETNVHNIRGINELFAYLYLLAFIYAVGSYLLRKKVVNAVAHSSSAKEALELISFKGQEVFYLLPTFLFNPYINHTGLIGGKSILEHYHSFGLVADFNDFLVFMGIWREAFEILFYAVIFIRIVDYISYLKRRSSSQTS